MCNQLAFRSIEVQAHLTAHLRYLSNIGSDRINWTAQRYVVYYYYYYYRKLTLKNGILIETTEHNTFIEKLSKC